MNLDARITGAEAELLIHVDRGSIKNWRYRGWLDHNGERHFLVPDAEGKLLVRDILRAERDTRRSGKSHRRIQPVAA